MAPLHVRQNLLGTTVVRVFVLLGLFTSAAVYEAVHLNSLADPDIWWHLRTGAWILENHAVPHHALFSQYPDLPWMATSWGFDAMAALAFKVLGLRVLPLLVMTFKVALGALAFLLARGSRDNFWSAVLLAAIAEYAIPDLPPQPVLCSIILFAVELALLFHSRRSGSLQSLYWLPLLFFLWANLHLQCMNGVAVLALFWGVAVLEWVCRRGRIISLDGFAKSLPLGKVSAVAAASVLATLANPYSYHLYGLVLKNASSRFLFAFNKELHSLDFRRPEHYVLLLLAMAAFFTLGCQRSRDLFKLSLMIVCIGFAFRIARDTWFIVLPSIAVMGDALCAGQPAARGQSSLRKWDPENLITAGLALVVFVVAVVGLIPSNPQVLLDKVGKAFPVRACDFVRQNQLPGPLFNEYRWGGFLTWYLPDYPVAIDDRQDLYGDEITEQYAKVVQALIPVDSDSTFLHASTILLDKDSGMATGLTGYPDFEVVYNDDLARILIRKH